MSLFFWGCEAESSRSETLRVDLALHGAHILTADQALQEFESATLLVRGDTIFWVGPDSLAPAYQARETIDARGHLLMPGWVNTHTHLAMTLFRGMADDLPLQVWLENHIWPAETQFLGDSSVYAGARLGIAEMLAAGTTTFNDMYFFEGAVARASDELGIRAMLGEGILDFPSPAHPDPGHALATHRALVATWAGHPRIRFALAPHATYTVSPPWLDSIAALSAATGARVHIHLSETQSELTQLQSRYQRRPVDQLAAHGLLNDRLIAAHGVWLDSSEQQLLAAAGAGIAHCPQSNLKLGSGVAPVPALLARGVAVGLGTDGAASNNDLDLLDEANTAALIQKGLHLDPALMPAEQVFLMGTRLGAEVLGWEEEIGSLEVGKRADMILYRTNQSHSTPVYDWYSLLIYSLKSADLRTVWVDGRKVWEGGRLLTGDEASIRAAATRWADAIQAANLLR